MKQLMEQLELDVPKWEGPTVCESLTTSSESSTTDIKPPCGGSAKEKVKKDLIKEERKREATQLTEDGGVKEETLLVKRERADSPMGINEEK